MNVESELCMLQSIAKEATLILHTFSNFEQI